jgi:hypothetical protein
MRSLSIFVGALLACAANGKAEQPQCKLTGIVQLPSSTNAVLEWPRFGGPEVWIAKAAERNDDFEILQVLPEEASIKVLTGSNKESRTLSTADGSGKPGFAGNGFQFVSANVYAIASIYQQLSGRSALVFPGLRDVKIDCKSMTVDEATALRELTAVLEKKEIVVVPDGDKFFQLLPQSQVPGVKTRAVDPARIPEVSADSNSTQETIPPGMIDFRGIHMKALLNLMSDLQQTRFDLSAPLPNYDQAPIFFRSESPFSKEEAIHALEVMIEWRGLKTVKETNGTMRVERLKIAPN